MNEQKSDYISEYNKKLNIARNIKLYLNFIFLILQIIKSRLILNQNKILH